MMIKPGILDRVHHWDEAVFLRVNETTSTRRFLITVAQWQSRTADGWGYIIIPLLLFGLHFSQAIHLTLNLGLAFGVERLVYWSCKNSFRRRRPANIVPGYHSHIIPADEFSFPSGHTSAAFLFSTMIVLTFGTSFLVLYAWAAAVAVSRVVLGVHFPTDTLVGSVIGTSIGFLAFTSGVTQ
jgi:undecaprenyl-diphosphatase